MRCAVAIFPATLTISREDGDPDSFTINGFEPACETITSRSRMPRNGHINTDQSVTDVRSLKTIRFVECQPSPLRGSCAPTKGHTRWCSHFSASACERTRKACRAACRYLRTAVLCVCRAGLSVYSRTRMCTVSVADVHKSRGSLCVSQKTTRIYG